MGFYKFFFNGEEYRNGFAIGAIIDFAGDSVPDGFLICDGSEIPKSTYDDLYTAIGDLWNTTGGADAPSAGNFRLPPQEVGGLGLYNRGVGATNGAVGTYQVDVFKSHNHKTWADPSGTNGTNQHRINVSGNAQIETSNTGDATETRPRSLTVLKCIKY